MNKSDYYQVLELDSSASPDEIKRSYRRLARLYHPDSNPNPKSDKTFLDIQHAYEVLSDPERKKVYDFNRAVKRSTARRPHAPGSTSSGAKSAQNRPRSATSVNGSKNDDNSTRPKGKTDEKSSGNLSSRLKTMLKAASQETVRPRRPTTLESNNSGSSSTDKRPRKDSLLGRMTGTFSLGDGVLVSQKSQIDGPGEILVQLAEKLLGKTMIDLTIDALESSVGTTQNVKIETESRARTISVRIPAGIVSGSVLSIKLPAEASFPKHSLKARVHIQPHPLVERDGVDVTIKLPISVKEALIGTELDVPTLDGPVRVRLPAEWDLEKRLRVKGKGLTDPATGRVGELFVKPYIVLPSSKDPNVLSAASALEHFYGAPLRRESLLHCVNLVR